MPIDVRKYTAHQHPGKFEGESPATEYFYEQMVTCGDGEDLMVAICNDGIDDYEGEIIGTIFETDIAEREALGVPEWVAVCEDSQGFVTLKTADSRGQLERKLLQQARAAARPRAHK